MRGFTEEAAKTVSRVSRAWGARYDLECEEVFWEQGI